MSTSSQASLQQLQRMRAKAQGEEARLINVKGRQLVIRLNLLLKTSAIHDVHNDALQRSIEFFIQAAADLLKVVSPLIVQGDQDQIYVNDFRIRGDATVYSNIRALVAELKQRGAGGMTLQQQPSRQDVLSLLEVVREVRIPDGEEGWQVLNDALAGKGVTCMSFNRYLELGSGADLSRLSNRNKVQVALKTYAKVLVTMKRATQQGGGELKPIDRLKLNKNVQSLIDLCFDDEVFYEGLSSLKYEGQYAYFHPVHVAMLSVQMGKYVGLSRKLLMDLALASLFYDQGRLRMRGLDIERPGELTSDEWDLVRRHPLRSVRELLRPGILTDGVRKRILVAFEHHLGIRGGGYPQRIVPRAPHLFSRIVAIADAYDALTTTRPHREGYLPAEALRILLDDAGKRFDPTLVRILINILQVYPIGTLVFLDSGEIASVYHHQSDPELRLRPLVRLLTAPNGQPAAPSVVNLGEKQGETRFVRSIVRALDADEAQAWLPSGAL